MWGRLPHKKKGQGCYSPALFRAPWCGVLFLEQNLQRELDLPGGGVRVRDVTEASAAGGASAAADGRAPGRPEVGPVKNVEELGPELKLGRLSQGKALVNREIKGGPPRTVNNIAPKVSKSTPAGLGTVIGILCIAGRAIGKVNNQWHCKNIGGPPPRGGVLGCGVDLFAFFKLGPHTADVAKAAGDP